LSACAAVVIKRGTRNATEANFVLSTASRKRDGATASTFNSAKQVRHLSYYDRRRNCRQ
jgi:hypothetical protein